MRGSMARHTRFADRNVSRLGFSTSFSGVQSSSVSDLLSLLTQTVVAGLHYRNNSFENGELRRREALFGVMVGAEYTRHRYDPRAEPDRVFLLDLPALTARYYGRSKDRGWEFALDAGAAFGAADSLVLSQAGTRIYWTERASSLGELNAKRNELSVHLGLELAP